MSSNKLAAHTVLQTLHTSGFQAFLAGGCVRDELLGIAAKDFDIATNATPTDVQKIFKHTHAIGAAFGVVLVIENECSIEVATFRSECGYYDGRHPTSVVFTTVEQDATRRDFTINGMYFDIAQNKLLDFVGGKKDVESKCIRTIGDAHQRFSEDSLRLLRAIRFAVQLDFTIEPKTFSAIKDLHASITKVSWERIRDEFKKILTSPNPHRGLELLDESGILKIILPEMQLMKGVEQPSQYHPEGDVFVHTMMLMKPLKNAPFELAFGALLHDVAKPDTFERAVDRIRFHGHDKLGAEKSFEICKRFHLSNDETQIICALVAEHLRFKDAKNMKVSTLKRFMSIPEFDLHLKLHWLDCMASHCNLEAHAFCTEKFEEFKKEPPPPTHLIKGQDLIELGLLPGPHFSIILRAIEDKILEGAIQSKQEALVFLKQYLKENDELSISKP